MVMRHTSRRWLLGALAAVIAASTALGAGSQASAKDNADNARPRPDFSSKSEFKTFCELFGGTFIEDGIGNTSCYLPDGTWIECDANGKDCWITDTAQTQLPGGPNVHDGMFDQVAASDDGAQTSDPVADEPTPSTDQGTASPTDDQQPTVKAKHGKHKKGKKHRHHRRRRK